ncbi:MAG: heat shock protein GrpE [Stenotrophomonas rhizophila]|jgi:molecular chaperone GrpE|uniref:Protein GrpE n=1 Tax=Stenotrophomonas rhizophila TaxID=216778 RepID=A0AAP5EDU3_9GAMM|nr:MULTISPECIES: nucleotide exchange factor GrpE [Stenotrophomonas]AOA72087.1 heat shock protein GrpE [Stenotrophomonas rhizophila]MDF2819313.1 heat shock protein GrpE [Stenotrophomonas rhizophila]MDQ1062977.1 molecular chaperone GrpE [Stenotrophomonas sp. SORGH_AS_0282]MDQ1108946.1 molecular chaperone GrpE [Stenotrophomonas rhizophila]MDQ1188667.1 molecular chaperone GrpE [Stenotrophomonas sp. SORGH_AS_0282]
MNQDQPDIASQTPAGDAATGDTLQQQLDALHNEVALLRSESLRERADLDNQRKRVARDVEQARRFANEKLLGELLPVFDSLDAGLNAAGAEPSPLREGLELTYKQLLKVAADNGLTLLDPTGQTFNPEHHQAISQVDAPGAAPGSVVQVFQKGYLLNDRLLRPALVVVARD